MSYTQMTAATLAAAMRSGELSASDIARDHLQRITAVDGNLSAFCETFAERVTSRAAAIDQKQAAGETLGALAGVPIASKDNLLIAGEHATAGSRMLAKFRAPFTATSLQRLEQADAILLGRTNMDEFGMGSTTETSAWQKTHNPFGQNLVPGGSSGGSAVAVSADMCPIAVGSDTGGSIRQPAAFCGVTGLKPTYGRVSRYGLVAYASSLDCVGAIARTAEDLALWLDCASGQDPADSTSLARNQAASQPLTERTDLRGLRIGIPTEWNSVGIDAEVLSATQAAAAHMKELGASIIDCELPSTKHSVAAYYLLATVEAASNLARYDGVHYGWRATASKSDDQSKDQMTTQTRSQGFGNEAQLRLLLGTFASAYDYHEQFYGRASLARRTLQRELATLFQSCDTLLCPTTPTAAPNFGDSQDDPLARYHWDALTVPASLAGIPALSMPCGNTIDGRPIGVQLMGPGGDDARLLQIAHVFQQHSQHHLQRAPL